MFDFVVVGKDFGFLIFIILLLERSAASAGVDSRYEACAPKTCGDININYPFYIQGQQEPYCGFSDKFGINCSNPSAPIINIPENDYVIDNIFYQNQTLRVNAATIASVANNCLPRIENMTQLGPFSVLAAGAGASSSLRLLSNCSETLPEGLQKYRKNSCDEKGLWGLAMVGDDRNLSVAMEECGRNVVVPVELGHGSYGDGDYEGVLRRGFSLRWNASDCSICDISGGRCGFNATTFVFACFCPDRPHRTSCRPGLNEGNKKLGLILGTGVAGSGVLLSICFILWFYKFKKSYDGTTLIWRMKTNKNQNLEAFTRQHGLAPKCYSYSDIKKMTNSFKDELGKGGYGVVYKGKLPDGRLVAAKLLNAANGNDQDFINEVLSISRTSHVNVVNLLGFCIQGKKRALVYEYMANGSLEKYIYSQNNDNVFQLGMEKLYQISLGVARGLEYLHRGCNTRILHFDIKPHNILLDEDFCPKISDFGMAKQYFPKKESAVSSFVAARGTIGYIAPELISRCFGVVSHKSDVYSFGMMILEIVGRRKNVIWGSSHESEVFFPGWAYRHLIIEKDLQLKGIVRNSEEDEISKKVILVGLWCIQTDPLHRPTMSKVIEMLEGDLEVLEIPPKPFFDNSPSKSSSASFDQHEPRDGVSEHSCMLE